MIGSWYHTKFKEYAKSKGIKLLRDDFLFIENSIRNMPQEEQKDALRSYLNEWLDGMHESEISSSGHNYGRFRANEFLRIRCGNKK